MTDIAVVHGNYLAHGGGEVVAERLAETFDAPLYYGFGDDSAVPDTDTEHVGLFDDSLLARWKRSPFVRDAFYAWAFQHRPELHEYDVLVQSGNEPGGYVPPDDQPIVKYVHSTPRAAYDRFPDKGSDPLVRAYAFATRVLYAQTLAYPDVYVANSELIARRVRRYWGIDDVRVVYPPVPVDSYGVTPHDEREPFFFTFSRLEESKRIDEIVTAFADRDDRLVVGGDGPEADRLRRMATDNVEFRGFLSESEKRDLLTRATGFVFAARNEDFGIVPVEALASGTPVVGVRDGYTRYQIRDGENGLLYDRGSENLDGALNRLRAEGVELDAEAIATDAERYGVEAFETGMREAVTEAKERVRIDP